MRVRPHDLADRISGSQPTERFTLSLESARLKAREILDQAPHEGYAAVVENWRQLPDGRIEFTVSYLRLQPEITTKNEMTGDQSRSLKPGDRVGWGTSTTDLGTVVGTSWSEVTIAWDDGETNSLSHNDMARVERVPGK